MVETALVGLQHASPCCLRFNRSENKYISTHCVLCRVNHALLYLKFYTILSSDYMVMKCARTGPPVLRIHFLFKQPIQWSKSS